MCKFVSRTYWILMLAANYLKVSDCFVCSEEEQRIFSGMQNVEHLEHCRVQPEIVVEQNTLRLSINGEIPQSTKKF